MLTYRTVLSMILMLTANYSLCPEKSQISDVLADIAATQQNYQRNANIRTTTKACCNVCERCLEHSFKYLEGTCSCITHTNRCIADTDDVWHHSVVHCEFFLNELCLAALCCSYRTVRSAQARIENCIHGQLPRSDSNTQ